MATLPPGGALARVEGGRPRVTSRDSNTPERDAETNMDVQISQGSGNKMVNDISIWGTP